MPSGLRSFARTTFGNWLSVSYLALVSFLLLFGFGVNGSYVAGLLGVALTLPTGAVLLVVVKSLGAWAETDLVVCCLLVFSYTIQAHVLGLLVRAARRRSERSLR
ncbi:SCO4225 family membrane protein [Streptomyces sp. NPDC051109]|uniref:SCO4225 family membrane protein n=1 Tax=Streptomyces sp. NPDC051109 TaxID=3365642 RepID=UPI0037ADEB34